MLLLTVLACASTTPSNPDTTDEEVWIDPADWPAAVGGDRPTRVFAPLASYEGGRLPLVLSLHGYGASGSLQELYFGLSPQVEARGFVLVAPDGLVDADGARFWNATDACCDFYGDGTDDVAYLTGLLDELEAKMPIDPDRIVVVGHSNGGFMAWRLACEIPDRLAGIASLAGATWLDAADCRVEAPVSALQMHGTADDTILYDGFPGLYPSAEASIGRAATLAGCDPDAASLGTADDDGAVAGAETERLAWEGCTGDVELWRMDGSGHIPLPTPSWQQDLLDWLLGAHRP
ncbi:MAG: alpha/beta fold hydrolase [Alphaproteobacteria bacterium]|nr:alpha/beta fold hydrolase [Alphaproteobacteria bacterium]MCB9695447.1 alpha/beta fold hydrolase [Alphaproteobacteria bacterium]